jgi:RNA 2',3'-cyclic 3'-phosphodiesterase
VRCFVAVWPSTAVLDALATLPRPAVDGVRWSTRDQWHVTLRFFGELLPADVERALATLALVAGSWPGPFEVQGGPGTRFLGPGLVVWPVEGLGGVARAVEQQTASIGQPVPDRRFVGHLTMARGQRGTDLRPARELLHALALSWTVNSLSLVQSELHPTGATYRDVETFPVGHARD